MNNLIIDILEQWPKITAWSSIIRERFHCAHCAVLVPTGEWSSSFWNIFNHKDHNEKDFLAFSYLEHGINQNTSLPTHFSQSRFYCSQICSFLKNHASFWWHWQQKRPRGGLWTEQTLAHKLWALWPWRRLGGSQVQHTQPPSRIYLTFARTIFKLGNTPAHIQLWPAILNAPPHPCLVPKRVVLWFLLLLFTSQLQLLNLHTSSL